MIIEKTEEEEL